MTMKDLIMRVIPEGKVLHLVGDIDVFLQMYIKKNVFTEEERELVYGTGILSEQLYNRIAFAGIPVDSRYSVDDEQLEELAKARIIRKYDNLFLINKEELSPHTISYIRKSLDIRKDYIGPHIEKTPVHISTSFSESPVSNVQELPKRVKEEYFAIYNSEEKLVVYGNKEVVRAFYSVRRHLIDTTKYQLKSLDTNHILELSHNHLVEVDGIYYPSWLVEQYKRKRELKLQELRNRVQLVEQLLFVPEISKEERHSVETTASMSRRVLEYFEKEKLNLPLDEF